MKKILLTSLITSIISCGPSALEQERIEKARADSFAKANYASTVVATERQNAESTYFDSINKPHHDSIIAAYATAHAEKEVTNDYPEIIYHVEMGTMGVANQIVESINKGSFDHPAGKYYFIVAKIMRGRIARYWFSDILICSDCSPDNLFKIKDRILSEDRSNGGVLLFGDEVGDFRIHVSPGAYSLVSQLRGKLMAKERIE